MNNYFNSNKKSDCNGCGACALRCPKHAITMKEDEEGFFYPIIDKSKCINCNLCKKICSNNPSKINEFDIYIAKTKDLEILKDSSSGGMFNVLAEYIIDKKGVVFGVKYDKKLIVVHDYVTIKKKLSLFRHSKYVRSDLKDSYIMVEKYLKDDRYVLFTGTPCQCAGLRSYLMKDYEKLITCDIICHANPSPKIFELFKKNIECKYNKKIIRIDFRNKSKYGWHSGNHMDVYFDDGIIKDIPEFTNAFQTELINRPSCYNCRFCTPKRYSDFTIGDLWGIDRIQSEIVDDNTGISLLSVNTHKAKNIFEEIKNSMIVKKIDKDLAWKYNHNSNIPHHKNRKIFFDKVKSKEINSSNIIYYLNKYTKRPLYRRILSKIKKILNK